MGRAHQPIPRAAPSPLVWTGMLHRSIDVVFQFLAPLAAALLIVPIVLGGVGLLMDRSQLVAARLWADRPVFTPKFASDRFVTSLPPSQIESALVLELLQTDSFTAKVLAKVEPQYQSWSAERRYREGASLRGAMRITTEGEHVFVVGYQTDNVDRGRRIVKAIVDAFGAEIETIELGQVGTAQTLLRAQIEAARKDMDEAVSKAQNYLASRRLDTRTAANDPNYQTLIGDARVKTDRYLTLDAQLEQANASSKAVSTLKDSFFRVIDEPGVMPKPINRETPALRLFLFGAAAIVALEALFVYVVARRDPRVRSVEEVGPEVGLKPLGSAPVLGRR